MKRHRPQLPAGFTLIELMVSIAIALLLILGVNQVFRASSLTTGAGQALSAASRDNRTFQSTIQLDGRALNRDPSSQLLAIVSQSIYAFRNAPDRQGDVDQDPSTTELVQGGRYVYPRTAVNDRVHRVDVLGFMARDLFRRQTSSGPTLVSSTMSSSEAWIWYGHLAIANNAEVKNLGNSSTAYTASNYFAPGDPNTANDNNYYASDWFLGRRAILFVPNLGSKTNNPNAENANYYTASSTGGRPVLGNYLFPLGTPFQQQFPPQPPPKSIGPGFNYPLNYARYDLASDTIQAFTNRVATIAGVSGVDWWTPMMYYRTQACPFIAKPIPSASGTTSQPAINAASTALTSPCVLRGCTQFIVEYAGDYLTQNDNGPGDPNWGQVVIPNPPPPGATPPVYPDGKIDFIVSNGVKKIRWYGFPRDINGDGKVDGNDVIPLRDLLPGQKPASFERIGPNDPKGATVFPAPPGPDPYAVKFDYTTTLKPPPGSRPAPLSYPCAWNPATPEALPKMLRITIAIDDANGRLNNAQVYEYIIDLQQ